MPAATELPPDWYPDPLGRFRLRYWDGLAWTASVATDSGTALDPPVANHRVESEEERVDLPPSAALLFHEFSAPLPGTGTSKRDRRRHDRAYADRAAEIWSVTLWRLEQDGLLLRVFTRPVGVHTMHLERLTTSTTPRAGLEGKFLGLLDRCEPIGAAHVSVPLFQADLFPFENWWTYETYDAIDVERKARGVDTNPTVLEVLRPQGEALLAEWAGYKSDHAEDAATVIKVLRRNFVSWEPEIDGGGNSSWGGDFG